MNKHYGRMIEHTIRKKGFNMAQLANIMKTNRKTLSEWLSQPAMNEVLIFQIGMIIQHDFSKEFPELLHGYRYNQAKQYGIVEKPVFEIYSSKCINRLKFSLN